MDSSLRLRIWTARRRHSTTQCALESRMVNFDRFAITDISASPSCLSWQRILNYSTRLPVPAGNTPEADAYISDQNMSLTGADPAHRRFWRPENRAKIHVVLCG
jgi:hypothetical protein